MEMISIGRRLRCPDIQPGVDGTIVRADRRRHVTGETVTYDVVWDNGKCTRSLSPTELGRPQWFALPEMRSVEACNELWFQHLIALTRARAQHSAPAAPAAPPRPAAAAPAGDRRPSSSAPARPREAQTSRAITQEARELLSRRGFEQVAVNTSQRVAGNVLQVAWMDGTTENAMFAALAGLKASGLVARIDLARSASVLMLQAAIEYTHERLFEPRALEQPEPALARVLLQATPEAYQRSSLTGVWPPMGHPASGQSYQQLLRCVFERWDDHRGCFCDTPTSRYMLSEKSALFPAGDDEASRRMHAVRERLQLNQQQAEEILGGPAPAMRQ